MMGASASSDCIGVDCPECESGRRHYLATGCLDSACPRDHGPLSSHGQDGGA